MTKLLSPAFTLLTGVVLALILNIPMTFLEGRLLYSRRLSAGIRRLLSITLSFLLVLGIFAAAALWIIPSLLNAVALIRFPETVLNTFFETNLPKQLPALVKNTASVIVRVVVALVFAVYTLANKELLLSQMLRLIRAWIPKHAGNHILHAISVTTATFRRFIVGQITEACILGSLCAAGMALLKLPYSLMTGTLVGVTALFPVVGAYAGAAAGAALIYTQAPFRVPVFLIFLTILQQIENNFIYPKVVGSKVKLPAIWVLASITVGGSLAGPAGMFLAVPSAASAYSLLKEATKKREALRK